MSVFYNTTSYYNVLQLVKLLILILILLPSMQSILKTSVLTTFYIRFNFGLYTRL